MYIKDTRFEKEMSTDVLSMSTDISSDDCEFAPESEDESYESKNTKLIEELAKMVIVNKTLQEKLSHALAQVEEGKR